MIKLVLINDVHEDLPLTRGNIYLGELTPIIYDPHTLKKVEPSYIIRCDDGKLIKIESECFIELREMNLNELLGE